MDLPTYVKSPDQENYNEELNQTLIAGLSDKGWTNPQITTANLTVTPVLAPDGTITTIAAFMPDGTQWYVTDGAPAAMVIKVGGALRRVSTTAFP